MTSANEETPKKSKCKRATTSDPSRFLPPGIYFRGKFIGIEHVADACGDRSDMMCQVAMAKMKAAIKTLGDHKRRIVINVSINGIKLLDEKDEDIIFDHPLARISYISRDISDSRAFGYVFNPGHDCHEFYGIKTEKAADVVVSSLRDLFQLTSDSNKCNTSLPENSSKFDLSWRMPSPPYSLKHGGFGEGGTLGRFKKSPHLLYRFYNTVSNTPVVSTGSPRKQGGFLTSYNRQTSAPTHHPPATFPTARNPDAPQAAAKTPSLSSSSSSNQNVNNSPSTSAVKSPMSFVTSKKSLSSISSLPVIESPPSSPPTFKGQSSRPGLSKESSTASVEPSNMNKLNTLEEAESLEWQSNSAEVFPNFPADNFEVFNDNTNNQMSWANFDEFEYSDESEGDKRTVGCERSNGQRKFDSNHHLSEEEEATVSGQSRKSSVGSAFKSSHLFLSFNGIDPFIDDPFFSNSVDASFDDFKIDDDIPEFDVPPSTKPESSTWMENAFQEVVPSFHKEIKVDEQCHQLASRNSNDKLFEDKFKPQPVSTLKIEEISWTKVNEVVTPSFHNEIKFDDQYQLASQNSNDKLFQDKFKPQPVSTLKIEEKLFEDKFKPLLESTLKIEEISWTKVNEVVTPSFNKEIKSFDQCQLASQIVNSNEEKFKPQLVSTLKIEEISWAKANEIVIPSLHKEVKGFDFVSQDFNSTDKLFEEKLKPQLVSTLKNEEISWTKVSEVTPTLQKEIKGFDFPSQNVSSNDKLFDDKFKSQPVLSLQKEASWVKVNEEIKKDADFSNIWQSDKVREFDFPSQNVNSNGKLFEEKFKPQPVLTLPKEASWAKVNEEIKKDADFSNIWQSDKVREFPSDVKPKNVLGELKSELERKFLSEPTKFNPPPPTSLKPMLILKSNAADDCSPTTSASTNPSEFPSPDIPPPPLPAEVVKFSPPRPTPPPLPPRRPQLQKAIADAQAQAAANVAAPVTNVAAPAWSDFNTLVTSPAFDKIKENKTDDDDPGKKLDTASILKLFAAPTTSPFSSPLPPSTAVKSTNLWEEPIYGNLRSPFIENNNVRADDRYSRAFQNSPQTYSPMPTSLIPPGVPNRRLSPNLFSFHSYSPTGRTSEQDPRPESVGFSRSLDKPWV